MRKIIKIEPTEPVLPRRKRVAAYARVSMECERLMHSMSAQISYYSELIQKNPEWEYAGVYADNFISGTETKKRQEFQRMISDCEKGLIDIIPLQEYITICQKHRGPSGNDTASERYRC